MLFVALFLVTFGRFNPSDRCSVYFSVLHDLFGRFRDHQTLGKGGKDIKFLNLILNRDSNAENEADPPKSPKTEK
jgi:hypothetical protein